MPDSVIDGFFVQKLTRQLASSEAINNFEANLVLSERKLQRIFFLIFDMSTIPTHFIYIYAAFYGINKKKFKSIYFFRFGVFSD